MIYKQGMSEEQYKTAIYDALFKEHEKCTYHPNYGKTKIDFVIADSKDPTRHLLWAEAKNDRTHNSVMLTQLLLTVKRTFFGGEVVPPAYIAVFNADELHLYNTGDFTEIFFRNDIEWKTRPSNHSDPRFKELQELVIDYSRAKLVVNFKHISDIDRFKVFIRDEFFKQVDLQGIDITIANLNHIFNEWCDIVKPKIDLTDVQWKEWYNKGVYPSDFFLADAYVGNTEDATLTDNLQVGILGTTYFVKQVNTQITFHDEDLKRVTFTDKGKAYRDFWKRYKRPPRRVSSYAGEKTPWSEILDRRDILVPRDVMERKGAFFTPRVWVTKAHEYLAEALGDSWQDEYIVYDCAAGSGNLLSGLYNQKNIYASDIDQQNVRIMIEETKPTFASNIFQFDFLNDDFIRKSEGGKVPDSLMDIMEDSEMCKKLVFLINPPYAESGNQKMHRGSGKAGTTDSQLVGKYKDRIGKASNELYAQFLARIYDEFQGCIIAEFSKLKVLQSPNFALMREWFKPELLGGFVVPGDSFDNVTGQFPIGFKMWNTSHKMEFDCIIFDVFHKDKSYGGKYSVINYSQYKLISDWYNTIEKGCTNTFGVLGAKSNDFQTQKLNRIESNIEVYGSESCKKLKLTRDNLFKSLVYYATRWSIEATWLNDRDQFLYPHTDPMEDTDFVNSCILFSIFHGNNRISVDISDNHWIPFTEAELGVTTAPFKHTTLNKLLTDRGIVLKSRVLSAEAHAVLQAGYEVFKYYHTGNNGRPFEYSPDPDSGQLKYNLNAALYDIRRFFQGVKPNGHMKVKSQDAKYQELIETLRVTLRELRDNCIAPKVYEYGFLFMADAE